MRSIKQLKNLKGKTALLRVDFNVPIEHGRVKDDFRIRKALPTIDFLIRKGAAKIILITHLGKDGSQELAPVIESFFKIHKSSKSKIEFFENVRKFSGELKNDLVFAKKLSVLGDIYVNDAFSVSHRAHASVVGLPKLMPSYAGLQLEEEVKNLSRTFKKPKHPFLFILGGAKFSTKIPLIKKYLKLADHVFIGGALLNILLKAKGYEIGRSLFEKGNFGVGELLKSNKLILPVDVVVKSGSFLVNRRIDEVQKDEFILDVGNKSVNLLKLYIKNSKLILWNGPLGKSEVINSGSTKGVLKLVAAAKAESIICGGDTVEVISKMKMENKFTFVSTGGGSTLDFLANGTLPGIKALK